MQIKIDLREVSEPVRLSNPHKPFFSLKLLETKPPLGRYIVITPLSFFLCPNPLPPMTPARLDPTNPSPPFPLREPHRCSTSVPSECKGLFHQKTLLLTKTEFEWLACQVQSHQLNHWGEKFCFLDGRSRTAIKTNKYQGTLKRKRSAPRMGSYIPRCKISLASFSLCQVKKRFRFCFPLAWKLSLALFRLLSLPRPWPPLTQAQMSPRDLSRAIAIVAISQFSLQNFCSGAINS